MRNRYLIDGHSVHYQDIQILDYKPPVLGACHIDLKFLTGNGELRRFSTRLYGSEAFALRLWLSKKDATFRNQFEQIEKAAKHQLATESQLTFPIIETNSGIPL